MKLELNVLLGIITHLEGDVLCQTKTELNVMPQQWIQSLHRQKNCELLEKVSIILLKILPDRNMDKRSIGHE